MPQGIVSLGLFFLLATPIILMNTSTIPRRSHLPYNMAKTFDGSPNLRAVPSTGWRLHPSLLSTIINWFHHIYFSDFGNPSPNSFSTNMNLSFISLSLKYSSETKFRRAIGCFELLNTSMTA